MIIALAAGWVVSRLADNIPAPPDAPPTRSTLLNILWAAGASLDRRVLSLVAIGAVGFGAVAMFIPPNAMGEWLVERSTFHAAALAIIPLFTYVNPEMAALQMGEVIHASTLPGSIVPLIALGSAVHLGTLALLVKAFNRRVVLQLIGVTVAAALVCAMVSDAVLYDPAHSPEDSHAFEDFGRPFHLLNHPNGPLAGFLQRISRPLGMNHLFAGIGIAGIVAMSTLLHRRNPAPPTHLASVAPPRYANAVLITAALVMAVVTVYTYIPPPRPLADELQAATVEFSVVYRRGEAQRTQQLVRQLDRRLAQVQWSLFLSGRSLPTDERPLIADLQRRLRELQSAPPNPDDPSAELQFQRSMIRLVKTLRA
ncbi:MAG TPA: hypothetical protein VGB55_08775 [Tepidisphaeraceae bacterium]